MRSNGNCFLFKVSLSSTPLVVGCKVYFSISYNPAVLWTVMDSTECTSILALMNISNLQGLSLNMLKYVNITDA